MGSGIYGIGISGLNAAQAGLLTTEHNISNANTAGFHRQQTIQSTNLPQFTGGGFIGNGVNVDTVKRIYSQFLDNQVTQAQTQSSQLDAYSTGIQQIDNMLSDSTVGLSPALQDFFQGVNAVASDPTSVPARQSMISSGQALVSRFNAIDSRFGEIRSGINTQISSTIDEINSYAQQIASLNSQVQLAESASTKHQANDLRDQRDQLISELNKRVQTSSLVQSDGSISVFIGNGQGLVVGNTAYKLAARPTVENPSQTGVYYQVGANTSTANYLAIKSNLLSGGTLGGLLSFREQSLDKAQNAFGQIATGVAQAFNDQHRLGTDLNGLAGTDFFQVGQPLVLPNSSNTGTGAVSVSISDVGGLTGSDYSLSYQGGTNYQLTRLSDNKAFNYTSTAAGVIPPPYTVDGITVTVTSVPTANDSFLIQPTRNGAANIAVAQTDTSRIAAAAPFQTAQASGNTGSGAISAGSVVAPKGNVTIAFTSATAYTVTDNTNGTSASYAALPANGVYQYPAGGWPVNISGAVAGDTFTINNSVITATPAATAPAKIDPAVNNNVTISFTSPTAFNVVDATTGNTLATAVAYNPANGATLNYNGWTTQLSGTPATGDVFTVAPNTGGTADSRNAQLLAGLQTKNTLFNNASGSPTTSFLGAYSQLVSEVGNKTREVQITGQAQTSLVTQVTQQQQSLSGVNLDEEAANLIRYQQAYQAAGKMIQVASTLFSTLISLGN
ncbi:MAG: flagellar hook-associated protein FlgK [Burkholderiales bacterium]